MTTATTEPPAHASGTLALGGDLPVHRLGFGAMRITGDGIWGTAGRPRRGHPRAAPGRRARRRPHRHGRLVRTVRQRGPHRRGAAPVPRRPASSPPRAASPAAARASGRPVGRPEYLRQCVEMSLRRLEARPHRPATSSTGIDPQVPARRVASARWSSCRTQGKIRHIGLSNVTVAELRGGAVGRRRSCRCRTATTSPTGASEDVLDHCTADGIGFIPWFPVAHRRAGPPGGPLDQAATRPRRHPGAARAGLAAAPLARHAAHPGHVVGRAPRGEHGRRHHRAHRRRAHRPWSPPPELESAPDSPFLVTDVPWRHVSHEK